jgi:hypothetical protein
MQVPAVMNFVRRAGNGGGDEKLILTITQVRKLYPLPAATWGPAQSGEPWQNS